MRESDRQTAEGILFTDQYQLTMAQLYYRVGLHELGVQFDHFFRRYPSYGAHEAGYCINAGLEWLLVWMKEAHFREQDLDYLHGQTGRAGSQVFADDFLTWLRKNGTFDCLTVHAVPEGRVVHPNVPLTVVQGPLAMAQLLETSLLNHLNFQILVATKAARLHDSARGRTMLEFGLRRGHGKGANAAARAALIGGADFTSNVGVSHVLGYPPKGTHAHSMVQVFMSLGMTELEAFRAYAETYPDDCLLLVDTIDTLGSGVPNAIRVFQELRTRGHEPVGIRLDSGDLAYLSIQAAAMLDAAGFPRTGITLSNDLDELVIVQVIDQIARQASRFGLDADSIIDRLVFGVGTRLVTSWGEPALGGVYKLVAVHSQGEWVPAIKVSDSPAKTPNPGHKLVWRVYDRRGLAACDLLSLSDEDPGQLEELSLRNPSDHAGNQVIHRTDISEIERLLVEVLHEGRLLYTTPSIEEMRECRRADMRRLDPAVRRLVDPEAYQVSLTQRLWDVKQELIKSAIEKSR